MRVFRPLFPLFLIFCGLSCVLLLSGKPESPAFRQLRELSKPIDFAVVGDSRAHTGISPTGLSLTWSNYELAATGHNFAVDGTDVLHHASFVLNGLLREKTVPRLILWAANPLQFDASRDANRLEQLVPSDLFWLQRAGAPLELKLDLLTMWLFPPWRARPLLALKTSDYVERAGIRSLAIQKAVFGLDGAREKNSRKYVTLDDGQVPFEVLEWQDRFERGAVAYAADYAKLELGEWHFRVAQEMAARARAAGAQLVILELPVAPWAREHLTTLPKHQRWRERMTAIAEQTGALFWDHTMILSEDDRMFGDPGHMPLVTAMRYSEFLARALVDAHPTRAALALATAAASQSASVSVSGVCKSGTERCGP